MRIMMKMLYLAALLMVVSLLLVSCGKGNSKPDKYSFYESVVDSSKPPAWGDDNVILIFCDDNTWKMTENYLRRSLERDTYIVVNEKYFTLKRGDITDIDNLSKYKNLLFMGDLKSKGKTSQHIRSSIDKRMTERVQNSGGEIFIAKNRWVTDQIIVYMIGDKLESLLRLTLMQGNRLFEIFLNRYGERLAYQIYLTNVIPDDFFQPYPFQLKIPQNYRLFSDDKQNRFLSFLYRIRSENRDFPDKYVSVYYEDMAADTIKVSWLLAKRAELAKKYYDGDEFDPKLIRSERLTFGIYHAWRIMGPWKNPKHDIGGGFQTFAFYDADQKRAYLIDNVVYYPAGDKLPILLELQKLSVTFKTK